MSMERFVSAQSMMYETALSEIRGGRKKSHWMWYIFPQIAGLGMSSMAQYYAIADLAEAKEYIQHSLLGPRLIEISNALLTLEGNNPTMLMGYPDDMKLRSSMTLFMLAAPEESVFKKVIDKYYGGETDKRTIELLNQRKKY